jgi:hypothetical protein
VATASKGKPSGKTVADRQADPLAALLLGATSICGNERIAMINGRLYRPGANLAGSDLMAGSLVVEQILPYKVLLRDEGRILELSYPDRVRRSPSARQSKVAPITPSNPNRTGRNPPAAAGHD